MLRMAFVLAILIPGLYLAVRNRYAALLLYIWFALFRPQEWMWIDITSLRLSMLISLLVVVPWDWLLSSWVNREAQPALAREALPTLSHPISIGMILFVLTGLVAQSNAINQALGWYWFDFLWRIVLVSLVAITLASSPMRIIGVFTVVAASLGFHAAKAGVMSIAGGGVRFENGLGGAFSDNNGYALAITMMLPLLVAAVQNLPQKWARWLLIGAALPSVFTIVSTYSRAGFLSLVAGTIVFCALQRRRFVALGALAAVALLALLVVPIPKAYTDRLQTIKTYEDVGEESALSRLHFWKVAAVMAEAHPLGIGLGNYEASYDAYDFSGGKFGTRRAVHSSHFQALAELGYPGVVVFEGMFVLGFWYAFAVRRRALRMSRAPDTQAFLFTTSNALITTMVCFLVGGSFIAVALNDLTWVTFAMIAALDRLSLRSERLAVPQAGPIDSAVQPPQPDQVRPAPAFRGAYRHPDQPATGPGGAVTGARR